MFAPPSMSIRTQDTYITAATSNLAMGVMGRMAVDAYIDEPPGLGHRNWWVCGLASDFIPLT